MVRMVASSSARQTRMVLMATSLPRCLAAILEKIAGSATRSVTARRYPELPHEAAVQMALIVEPRGSGYLRETAPGANEPACECNALLKNIGMRRQPELACECAQQLKAARTCFLRQISELQWSCRIGVDSSAR